MRRPIRSLQLPQKPPASVIQAPPSVPPPAPGVNRLVIALAAIIVLIGAGAALSLFLR